MKRGGSRIDILIRNTSGEPLYKQIYSQIKQQIIDGTLQPGEMLPSIRSLAKDLRISVITTKRVYDELEQDSFIHSVGGKGCFVAEQNTELIRESLLKELQVNLEEAVNVAKRCDLSYDELSQLLQLFWKD